MAKGKQMMWYHKWETNASTTSTIVGGGLGTEVAVAVKRIA